MDIRSLDYSTMDKRIWIWLTGNHDKGLRVVGQEAKGLSSVESKLLWDFVFEKMVTNGNTAPTQVRGAKAIQALRLRSLAYRRQGVPSLLCFPCAARDLMQG